jgi:hypothetical protein
MQWLDSYKTPDSLHLHHNTKNAPFLQTKGPTISKMDIYFCPFFQSEPISFSEFYRRLWDIEGPILNGFHEM